ncbi:hypothetical protein [Maledivibacter halophilus]|nr:hypothetical protein [Maledivibacter halophilus]
MTKEINLDVNIIKKNKIPVLVKSSEWKKLFDKSMTKTMRKLADKLEDLVNEEKEIIKQLKKAKKEKKKLMNKVLKLSDEANSNNSSSALIELENTKNRILEVNDELDELRFRLEMLPKEIHDTNYELLKETIVISYEDITQGKKKINYLDKEIEAIRKSLGEMWEEKFSKEKRINELYLYLHGTLGHEETDKMDRRFL